MGPDHLKCYVILHICKLNQQTIQQLSNEAILTASYIILSRRLQNVRAKQRTSISTKGEAP